MAHHKPPQIDTYNGWRIATVDCRPKGTNCDLNGVRLWFNREGYYVIIGVPAEVCYALAVYGREATHVNKSWGNGWGCRIPLVPQMPLVTGRTIPTFITYLAVL
ncbi:uncharacterized protein N7446_005634 [Penicillium canescens]|uniref:uncharacterized protein n=1 Tax=Penicillium canescens TaxID=5083 RepID=UPI0026E09287|nr:uncharacterized protein N7446_005634 [Penicillium canescens]KAJ6061514.1 hypothetical protein N7446_005634 [Penicillium canescens]